MHEQRGEHSLVPIWPAATYRNFSSTQSVVSPARCGERSESEANFCVRSAVRLWGGWIAGGRSASRNGICPLQTLLPRLFHPKAVQVAPTYHPRWGNGTSATATSRNLIVASWTSAYLHTMYNCTVYNLTFMSTFSYSFMEFKSVILSSLRYFVDFIARGPGKLGEYEI